MAIPLMTGLREVSRIDLHTSPAARLPRPCLRGFLQESTRLAEQAAREAGAKAVFNGAGGDNIFCSLQSGAPSADRLLVEGIGRGVWQSLLDMSVLAQASVMDVALDAVRRAWFGKPPFRERLETALLSPVALALLEPLPRHHWLTVPPGALPGKAMHVRMIAFAQSYVESLDPQTLLPVVAPLLSQPLVELCLTIPSWFWFEAGHNRVLARHAFADRLPGSIAWRRSKSTPDCFLAQIYEHHRAEIRDMLLDGELARRGLIDLRGTGELVDRSAPLRTHSFERLLQFVDVEAWAAGW